MPLSDTEVDLDWRGDTPDSLDNDPVLPPGKYHIIITSVKRETEKKPCLRVRYQVLAGTSREPVGMTSSERFYLTPDAAKRLKILAHRLGLVKDSEIGTRTGPTDFRLAIGRELCVEVINEQFAPDKEKQKAAEENRPPELLTSSKWSFAGYWVPEDPRVADVPKDPSRAAQVRASMGAAVSRPPATQPATTPPLRQTVIPTVNQPGAYDDV